LSWAWTWLLGDLECLVAWAVLGERLWVTVGRVLPFRFRLLLLSWAGTAILHFLLELLVALTVLGRVWFGFGRAIGRE